MNRFSTVVNRVFNTVVLLSIVGTASIGAQTLAFPEAEGFGRWAVGGRGGKVVTVTNLQDYTSKEQPIEGSLRWALDQYVSQEEVERHFTTSQGTDSVVKSTVTVYEPLTVVFNVAGNIVLKEDLKVKRDYLTIAGQSAPGDGVCITGHSMTFNGATAGELWYWGPYRHDLIVRYLRFRPSVPDSSYVTYGTDVENYRNVIFDHCTMTWANEECLALYDTRNTTVQWCIVAEGLYSANHKKGMRSYCGVWGGQMATYHHNLIASNNSRNIRFNGARSHDTVAVVDYRNNVVYNWGTNNSGQGLEMQINSNDSRCELNMVNNYYKHGPASPQPASNTTLSNSNKAIRFVRIDQTQATYDQGRHGSHYITGNYLTHYPAVTADNWNYGVQFNYEPYKSDSALAHRCFRAADYSPEVAAVQPEVLQTAEEAFAAVLAAAGATCPKRDWQDQRIADEALNGTATGSGRYGSEKGIIDDPATVGGWPELTGTPYTDTDGDGIPDAWETAHGLDPQNPTDGALITASGYSNLEIYLNSLQPVITSLANEKAVNNFTCKVSPGGQITLHAAKNLRTVHLYSASGQLISAWEATGLTSVHQLPISLPALLIVDCQFADDTRDSRLISTASH